MKDKRVYISTFVTPAIALIGFLVLSGCSVEGEGGGSGLFPGGLPIERVSVNNAGTQADGLSFKPDISTDGRYVTFYSSAADLVSGDSNVSDDVFVYDRTSHTVERVSVNEDGQEGDGGSTEPSMSSDGGCVVFQSLATNLISGDTNGVYDIFVYDRVAGTVERVSTDGDGVQGDGHSFNPVISADERFVVFHSSATNLVSGDSNAVDDVFVHERSTGAVERLSVDGEGVEGNGASSYPALSADGRYIAFQSRATNLISSDTNGRQDVFVHDRTSGSIERVSVDGGGLESSGDSYYPAVSTDGRYVTFYSGAADLVPGDTNGVNDIFIFDRTSDTIERVSVDNEGVQGNGHSYNPAVSADGRYVAFYSTASNLVPGDTNGAYDIFVFDRTTDTIERVSVGADGLEGSGNSYNPAISADGRYSAFGSDAANLVSDDTNSFRDVFVAPVGQ